MLAASTAGLSTAARPICSGSYPVASLVQRGKRTQRRQAQAVSWAVKSSAAEPSHCLAAPLSVSARTMPAASTAGLSTAARPSCSGFYPVATMLQRRKLTQRRQARSLVPACHLLYERGARGTESCRSSVEQSGQNDARRLRSWLEHGSKAQLQRILSGRFAGASRQAHAKAASTSSLVAVKS